MIVINGLGRLDISTIFALGVFNDLDLELQ